LKAKSNKSRESRRERVEAKKRGKRTIKRVTTFISNAETLIRRGCCERKRTTPSNGNGRIGRKVDDHNKTPQRELKRSTRKTNRGNGGDMGPKRSTAILLMGKPASKLRSLIPTNLERVTAYKPLKRRNRKELSRVCLQHTEGG